MYFSSHAYTHTFFSPSHIHILTHTSPPYTSRHVLRTRIPYTHICLLKCTHTSNIHVTLLYIHTRFLLTRFSPLTEKHRMSLSLSHTHTHTHTLSRKHFSPWYIHSAYTHISVSCKSNSSHTFFFLTYTRFHMTTPRHKLILSRTFIFTYTCLSRHTYQ